MVEFALVLPILLMLLYGLMEVGRLLFIYASTVSAARQAARYGAATGISPNGMPYYQDCDGIIASARQLGFINPIANVQIAYDAGVVDANGDGRIDPTTEIVPLSPANPACGAFTAAENGNRIKITVTSRWQPLTPLVPLSPFDIVSTSERTILASVNISVTGLPAPFGGTGGTPALTVTVSPATYSYPGQTISYTYVIKNIGDADLIATFNVTDPAGKVTISCPAQPSGGRLAPNATYTCTGTYAITQADINFGYFSSTAVAFPPGATPDSTTKTTKIIAQQNAALTLRKTPNRTASITSVTYTYELTNSGNVTLSSDSLAFYRITDDKLGNVCQGGGRNDPNNPSAPVLPTQIAPGETVYCTVTHDVTAAEIAAGSLTNTAIASASYLRYDEATDSKTETAVSATASATVITSPIALSVTGTAEGSEPYLTQQIRYNFSVQNISAETVNLTGITIEAFTGHGTQPTILCSGTINPDATLNCSPVYYNVTQEDLDSVANGTGDPVLITVTATATSGATTYTATKSLYPVDLIRRPKLEVRTNTSATVGGAPSTTTVTIEGVPVTVAVTTIPNMVTYTYSIVNTGNVTLSPPVGGFAVTDSQITDEIVCSDPNTPLPPNGSKTCSAVREITDADIARGSVIGATATSGVFGINTYNDTGKSMVLTSTSPKLQLEIIAPASVEGAGRIIEFTYILTNTGNADLSTVPDATPYDFTTASLKGSYPSCAASVIPIGESVICRGTYKTLRSDVTLTLTNSTRATAYTPTNVQVLSNVASVSVTVNSPSSCSVSHKGIEFSSSWLPSGQETFGMKISNFNDFSIDVSSITVYYNDNPNNQQITELSLSAGNVIWQKSNQNMSGSYTFDSLSGNVTLEPGATDVLFFISGWKTLYTKNNAERIVIRFSDASCPDLDSSVAITTPTADMQITKTNGVATLDVNATTTYTIRVTNGGGDSITNAKLTDPVAAGLEKQSVACTGAAGNKCVTPPSVLQLQSGSFALPKMDAGNFYEIAVVAKVTAGAGATVSNTATVTMPLGTNDSAPGNNSATDADTITNPTANPAVTKSNNVAAVRSGETTSYAIRVSNPGPSTLTGLKLRDPDTGSHTKTGSITCSGDPGRCVTPPTISQLETGYTLPTLAAGEYYEIVVPARIDAPTGSSAVNTANLILPAGVNDPDLGNNSATDTDSVTAPEADLAVTKDNEVSAVSYNANIKYKVRVSNAGPSAVTGAILTDPAAAGLSKQSVACSAAAGNVCVSAPSVAALEGSGATLPLLEVGKFYEIEITIKITNSSGTVTNVAQISPPAGVTDPNNGNNSASDSDPVISVIADLRITKTDGATSVNTGGTTTYTIIVTNAGPSTATNAVFKDAAVSGLNVTSVTCSGASCPAAGSVTVAAMQGAGITIPSLASGASVTFTVNGTVNAVSGSVTNVAEIVPPGSLTDPDDTNNSASDTDTINMRADLSITKTDGITSMLAGASTTYTIVVSNAGPSPANNAIFKDSVINGLTVTGVSCGSPSGGAACPLPADTTVNLMQGSGILIPTLPSGGSVTFTVTGTANGSASSIANVATITAPAGVTDPNTGNNSATDATNTVLPAADLAITKTDGLTVVGSGAPLEYTITVTNNGPSAANGAILKDAAITGFNVTTVTCRDAAGGAVCPSAPTKTALQGSGVTINTLPSGGSMTFVVAGTVTATSGTLSNTATITAPSGISENNPSNNSATDNDTTVRLEADFFITKTDGATSVVSGSPITYTIVVTNDGPSAVSGAVFKDPAVSGLTVSNVSCSASGGATCPSVSVAAMQGSGITIGNMPDNSSLTFTVTGTVAAAGGSNLTNTATVTVPGGVTDAIPSNNTASDTDSVTASVCAAPGSLTLTAPSPLSGTTTYTWTINNGTGVALTLTGISVTWTSQSGKLSTVQLNGVTIASPGGFSPQNISGSWNVNTGSTTLKLIFSKTSTITKLTLTFSQIGCGPISNP